MPHWAAAFTGCLIRVSTYIKRIDRNDQTLMNMVSGSATASCELAPVV